MQDAVRPGALVQVVDVLRHQRQPAAALRQFDLEPRQREMRRVGLRAAHVAPAQIIEGEYGLGIALEPFRRRQLHRIEARPDPLARLVAERAEAALGRNAGAGQDEDVARHSPLACYALGNSSPIAR